MKFLVIIAAMTIAASLCGCAATQNLERSAFHGRYVGVGIYHPEAPWTKMVAADALKAASTAKTIDDQAIIVVEDSDTGEIRACGDLTGYCVGMNPWKTGLTSMQIAPINLTEHKMPPKSGPQDSK